MGRLWVVGVGPFGFPVDESVAPGGVKGGVDGLAVALAGSVDFEDARAGECGTEVLGVKELFEIRSWRQIGQRRLGEGVRVEVVGESSVELLGGSGRQAEQMACPFEGAAGVESPGAEQALSAGVVAEVAIGAGEAVLEAKVDVPLFDIGADLDGHIGGSRGRGCVGVGLEQVDEQSDDLMGGIKVIGGDRSWCEAEEAENEHGQGQTSGERHQVGVTAVCVNHSVSSRSVEGPAAGPMIWTVRQEASRQRGYCYRGQGWLSRGDKGGWRVEAVFSLGRGGVLAYIGREIRAGLRELLSGDRAGQGAEELLQK